MASRAEQKAQARAERIEYERQLADAARRKQRLSRLAGVVVAAVVIIIAAVVISSSGNGGSGPVKLGSKPATVIQKRVNNLLAGIPQSGSTLGNPSAPIQITEFGDLECSACDQFALATNVSTSTAGVAGSGLEDQLINTYVRTGKASFVYRSLDTATGNGATPQMFTPQQVAALAAGKQGKAWYYIELFYNEQQAEGTTYVDQTFLDNIAKQVPGLNYSKWLSALNDPSLTAQVASDQNVARAASYTSTPTVVIRGPKGQAPAISGVPQSWSQLQQQIKQVGG
jgi:protein-disulfide isomerase